MVRADPGTGKQYDDKVTEAAKAVSATGTPVRAGVNAGGGSPSSRQPGKPGPAGER